MPKNNKNIIQSPKGMHDILPPDQPVWEKIRKVVAEVADSYNFWRIDTPIVEDADLFERPLGETSDVVEKQMFFVKSKGDDRLVLRPEGTAPIVRSYIQNGLSHLGQPLKLYYEGPMFRYEQPQSGRFRQFHQAGFEVISTDDDSVYDAQVILACLRVLDGLKIKDLSLQINTIGCKTCRPVYRKELTDFYKNKIKDLCADCQRRLKTNPLRLLDCKNEKCSEIRKDAPAILDNICSYCRKHFRAVLEFLDELKIPYMLNNHLVRGFDYYTRTVFEIFTEGFDFALGAGGRYDYLLELLGGRPTPAVGGSLGLERIVEVIKNRAINIGGKKKTKVFFVYIGDVAKKRGLSIIESLLKTGIDVQESLGKESLKAQLRNADKA
ncbi:MAG: histidine--tRNA ligase, partial [Patescibacteria group bacterium]